MSTYNSLAELLHDEYNLQVNVTTNIYDAINKIFQITTDTDTLIIKLINRHHCTKYRISFERKIMNYAYSNHINVSQPFLPTSKNEPIYRLEDQAYYSILTRKCTGHQHSSNSSHQTNYILFGKALSELHNLPTPQLNNPKFDTSKPSHLISTISAHSNSPLANILKTIIYNLYQNIESTRAAEIENTKRCICHGDAWPGNALYSNNSCTLIDFEHTRIADPTFDISTFIWWLTGLNYSEREKFNLWKNFAKGYGMAEKSLLNKNTKTMIKINQLRSLIFLYNNIILNKEIINYAHLQTSNLINKLNTSLKQDQILEALWNS